MNRVQIYTSSYCGYCTAAKALLDDKGIDYEEINISQDREQKRKVMEEFNWRTVPIIVINDRLIGGYRELKTLEIQHKLDDLLNQ